MGLKVGSESNVQYVVLQMHFLTPPADEGLYTKKTLSGHSFSTCACVCVCTASAPSLVLDVTMDTQPYVAGIFLLGAHAGEGLPPGQPSTFFQHCCLCMDVCVCVWTSYVDVRVYVSYVPADLTVEVACEFTDSRVIYPFAFRTHAHSLGKGGTCFMCCSWRKL